MAEVSAPLLGQLQPPPPQQHVPPQEAQQPPQQQLQQATGVSAHPPNNNAPHPHSNPPNNIPSLSNGNNHPTAPNGSGSAVTAGGGSSVSSSTVLQTTVVTSAAASLGGQPLPPLPFPSLPLELTSHATANGHHGQYHHPQSHQHHPQHPHHETCLTSHFDEVQRLLNSSGLTVTTPSTPAGRMKDLLSEEEHHHLVGQLVNPNHDPHLSAHHQGSSNSLSSLASRLFDHSTDISYLSPHSLYLHSEPLSFFSNPPPSSTSAPSTAGTSNGSVASSTPTTDNTSASSQTATGSNQVSSSTATSNGHAVGVNPAFLNPVAASASVGRTPAPSPSISLPSKSMISLKEKEDVAKAAFKAWFKLSFGNKVRKDKWWALYYRRLHPNYHLHDNHLGRKINSWIEEEIQRRKETDKGFALVVAQHHAAVRPGRKPKPAAKARKKANSSKEGHLPAYLHVQLVSPDPALLLSDPEFQKLSSIAVQSLFWTEDELEQDVEWFRMNRQHIIDCITTKSLGGGGAYRPTPPADMDNVPCTIPCPSMAHPLSHSPSPTPLTMVNPAPVPMVVEVPPTATTPLMPPPPPPAGPVNSSDLAAASYCFYKKQILPFSSEEPTKEGLVVTIKASSDWIRIFNFQSQPSNSAEGEAGVQESLIEIDLPGVNFDPSQMIKWSCGPDCDGPGSGSLGGTSDKGHSNGPCRLFIKGERKDPRSGSKSLLYSGPLFTPRPLGHFVIGLKPARGSTSCAIDVHSIETVYQNGVLALKWKQRPLTTSTQPSSSTTPNPPPPLPLPNTNPSSTPMITQ